MRIIFFAGGFINEQGPFEPGAEVAVPPDVALCLVNRGLATLVPSVGVRPITVGISTSEVGDHV
jgi:hypothetical protein